MSNLTDALIAAKLVGGSGGSGGGSGLPDASGQADNTALSVQSGSWAASGAVLPPITGNITTVFAEQTLAFSKRNGVYGADPLNLVLAVGETYTVTWDGTDYTCTAVDDGDGGVAVGNLSILGMGPDTEEPFMFGYFPGDATYIFSSSSAASHTIGIYTGEPQTPADGSVMIVQNGAWVPVPSGGGGGGSGSTPLIVHIDWDDNLGPDGSYFADRTYNEVRDAIDNGQIVLGTASGFYALTEDVRGTGVGGSGFIWTTFSLAVSGSNHKLIYERFVLQSDNTVTSYAGYVLLTDL